MNNVLLDNWSFQSIGELYARGYDPERTQVLVATADAHGYNPVVHGELQLEALVHLLTHVVLRDYLKLDHQYMDAWTGHVECFEPISDAGIIFATAPIIEGDEVVNVRQRIVKELCRTEPLRAIQAENERSYAAEQRTTHPFESQIMWGGAGMLARSAMQRLPYVGHPLRQRFIESTNAWRPLPDPTRTVLDLVSAHKATIYSTFNNESQNTRAKLMLPAVAAEVITRAGAPEELFPIAVELRDKYKDLRMWLGEMRTAMEEEDTAKLMGFKKTLAALARDVARATGGTVDATSTLDIAVSSVTGESTVGISGVLDGLRDAYERRFTVRHDLMNMVKAPAGERAMDKLGRMFGKR